MVPGRKLVVAPVTCVLQSLAQRREEVDLIGGKRVLDKSFGQHAAQVGLDVTDHLRSLLSPVPSNGYFALWSFRALLACCVTVQWGVASEARSAGVVGLAAVADLS